MPVTALAKRLGFASMTRVRWLLLIALVGVNGFAWLVAGFALYESHQQANERAVGATQNFAAMLDQSISGDVKSIDLTLATVTDELERRLRVNRRLDVNAANAFMLAQQQRLFSSAQIRFSDAAGRVIARAGDAPTAHPRWGDRDFFQLLRANPHAGRVVGRPVVGRSIKLWLVPFALRYNNPDGSFAGVVSIGIPVEHFYRLLATLDLGAHGAALLRDSNLGLITRFPAAGKIGDIPHTPVLGAAMASGRTAVTFHSAQTVDGVERTATYRRLNAAPFHLVVGLATRDYMRAWFSEMYFFALGLSVFLLVSSFGTWLLYRLIVQIHRETERSQALLRGASDGIHVLDRCGNVIEASDSFCRMLGYPRDEVMGMNIMRLDSHFSARQVAEFMSQMFGRGEPLTLETRHRRKDGSVIDVEVMAFPFELDGQPVIFGSSRDTTLRRQTEAELVAAREQAEQANRAKSRFLATMSHEIRTPMNGILGMAQLLAQDDTPSRKRQDYARTILHSGRALLTLLNDILDLSKVEAGKMELESTGFGARQMLREVRMLFTDEAAQKHLALETVWLGLLEQRYVGDPHRLCQMLSNLVGNALKFTERGRVRIEGRELRRDGAVAELEFVVSDSGMGIAPDKLPLLFQPFSQADSSTTRQFGGSGLGLSIVRSLAQRMGGAAGCASTPGEGSRFWFRVQVGLPGPDAEVRAAEEAGLAETEEEGRVQLAGHVLVVEDNPTNRKVLVAMLDSFGLRVTLAENGREAVMALAEGLAPDAVLMDIQMPVMDGYQATERIRAWEQRGRWTRTPIIALTADAYEEDRKHCLAVDMDDFLSKPIDIHALARLLRRWLDPDHGAAGDTAAERFDASNDAGQPVFDEPGMLSRLGGDRQLARIMIESAANGMPVYFDQLEQAVATGRTQDAVQTLHAMLGLVAQIGGAGLSGHLRDVYHTLKCGATVGVATVSDLRQEYSRLSETLRVWQ